MEAISTRVGNALLGTEASAPTDLDFERIVHITDSPCECDEDSLFFLTQRADGSKRELALPCHPYAIVCDDEDAKRMTGERVIITDNARRALSRACYNACGLEGSRMRLIAVTGTNGKTTVAEMITHILRFTGADVGYIGTGTIRINETALCDEVYSMTTPDPVRLYTTLREMDSFGCQYAVIEASSHAIALSKLSPLKFEVGLFTNLSSEHRDFHPTMDDYFATKLSLFDSCKYGIFNLDCPYSSRAHSLAKCNKESIGIISRADVYATDVEMRGLRGSSFFYREDGLIFGVDLQLAGAFNVYNALMALRCCIMLGIKPCEAKRAINALEGVGGRMERLDGDINVIIDYAHTPFAVENILKTLYSHKRARQSLYVVIGCGGERDRTKRAQIGRIAEKYARKIYLTEDNSRSEPTADIIRDILSGISDPDATEVIISRSDAIRTAILHAERGDTVAILGKGREGYIIRNDGCFPFSDKAEAISALRLRRRNNENNS